MLYPNFNAFYTAVTSSLDPKSKVKDSYKVTSESSKTKKIREIQLNQLLDLLNQIKTKYDDEIITEQAANLELYTTLVFFRYLVWDEEYVEGKNNYKSQPKFAALLHKLSENAPDGTKQAFSEDSNKLAIFFDDYINQIHVKPLPEYSDSNQNITNHLNPLDRLVRRLSLLIYAAGHAKTQEQADKLYQQYKQTHRVILHLCQEEKVLAIPARFERAQVLLKLCVNYFLLLQKIKHFEENVSLISATDRDYYQNIITYFETRLATLINDWYSPPQEQPPADLEAAAKLVPPPVGIEHPAASSANPIVDDEVDDEFSSDEDEAEATPSSPVHVTGEVISSIINQLPEISSHQDESSSSQAIPVFNPRAVSEARLLHLITQLLFKIQLRDNTSTEKSAIELKRIFDPLVKKLSISTDFSNPLLMQNILDATYSLNTLAQTLVCQTEKNFSLLMKLEKNEHSQTVNKLLFTLVEANNALFQQLFNNGMFAIDKDWKITVTQDSLTIISNYFATLYQFFNAFHRQELRDQPSLKDLVKQLHDSLGGLSNFLNQNRAGHPWCQQLFESFILYQTKSKLSEIIAKSKCTTPQYAKIRSFIEPLTQIISDPTITSWSVFREKTQHARRSVIVESPLVKEIDKCIINLGNLLQRPQQAPSRTSSAHFQEVVGIVAQGSDGKAYVLPVQPQREMKPT